MDAKIVNSSCPSIYELNSQSIYELNYISPFSFDIRFEWSWELANAVLYYKPTVVSDQWNRWVKQPYTQLTPKTINVTMKKNSRVRATSWYHCVPKDSRISKMRVINPLHALVHPQTQKILSCMDCQSQTATSQNSPLLVNRSAD
jgi:hypothetical protein